MDPYSWFIVAIVVALATLLIFILPRLVRKEAIEYQERYVIQLEETVRANPIPLYQERHAAELAELERMRAAYQRRYGKRGNQQAQSDPGPDLGDRVTHGGSE